MTPRRVVLTLELTTDVRLADLRRAKRVMLYAADGASQPMQQVLQVQANVITPAKPAAHTSPNARKTVARAQRALARTRAQARARR